MTDETALDAPLTFGAYATRIGKSRPYVSSLKAKGVLHGEAFTINGKINPDIADAQRAAAADPARNTATRPLTSAAGTYASERALKTAADRKLAEHDLAVRRGAYVERALIGPALTAFTRELRDGVLEAIREAEDIPAAELAVENFLARKSAERTHDGVPAIP